MSRRSFLTTAGVATVAVGGGGFLVKHYLDSSEQPAPAPEVEGRQGLIPGTVQLGLTFSGLFLFVREGNAVHALAPVTHAGGKPGKHFPIIHARQPYGGTADDGVALSEPTIVNIPSADAVSYPHGLPDLGALWKSPRKVLPIATLLQENRIAAHIKMNGATFVEAIEPMGEWNATEGGGSPKRVSFPFSTKWEINVPVDQGSTLPLAAYSDHKLEDAKIDAGRVELEFRNVIEKERPFDYKRPLKETPTGHHIAAYYPLFGEKNGPELSFIRATSQKAIEPNWYGMSPFTCMEIGGGF